MSLYNRIKLLLTDNDKDIVNDYLRNAVEDIRQQLDDDPTRLYTGFNVLKGNCQRDAYFLLQNLRFKTPDTRVYVFGGMSRGFFNNDFVILVSDEFRKLFSIYAEAALKDILTRVYHIGCDINIKQEGFRLYFDDWNGLTLGGKPTKNLTTNVSQTIDIL